MGRSAVPAWDEAAFTDVNSRLGKRIHGGALLVPGSITLDPQLDALVWKLDDKLDKAVSADRGLLDAFVRLWRLPGSDILAFARKWGVLWLNSEGRPTSVRERVRAATGIEALAVWRVLSRKAAAVLNIAAAERRGDRGTREDWKALSAAIGPPAWWEVLYDRDVMTEREALFLEVNYFWLSIGEVGFHLNPIAGGWRLAVSCGYGCVFSAIALQLALTLVHAESLYTCSGCGMPYIRTKKAPQPGQANFCDACGAQEALRQADLRRRERMAEARRLNAAGSSIKEIADQLGTKAATIRGWLKKGR